ncbi:formylglycine-generating enzyme family protein [Microbacterium amylolyticum]|uniref:Formylglycine-generating enzyme required for sulfatase activity n=1 Tax=Microbacterium amylolyticum TaxID=936337 RepID=A0ABS4ZE78_9MICO|nr:SUMF1/EgtB/PvdO family nonheme iron enzyme [Microbacterium amylolyticum]MBP2435590.1 formylglycine-generating enzyme required for sulfatase activity [Microbacterium amylolyticum]
MTPDIELARVPSGSVTLRDARRRAQRTVELEAFEIGVFAVTQELVAELIGESAAHPRRPAAHVSWQRAIRLCNAASEWEGLDSAYTFDGEQVTWHVDADGYRLPTEAEWEFACRAGSPAAHYGPLADVAWTAADNLVAPRDVGGKLPNLFGTFDMLGNMWEWCWDLFDVPRDRDARVIRGGSFATTSQAASAHTRSGARPRQAQDDIGVRFARGAFDGPDAQGWSAKRDRINEIESDDGILTGWVSL